MKLLVINGSPRGPRSNTRTLLSEFLQGYQGGRDEGATEIRDLTRLTDPMIRREMFAASDLVLIGFPLYTDSMPGLVMQFISDLAPLCGREDLPALAFLVQCGFPETAHIGPLERYLERLAERLGCPYLGTMARGGCEGVRLQPPEMNRRLFDQLRALGAGLAGTSRLDPRLVSEMAGMERLSWYRRLLLRALSLTGNQNTYWDMQLKKNGAYEQRHARPYAPAD